MNENKELYFEDPLLKMGVVARLWLRFVKNSLYVIVSTAALIMLLSDVVILNAIGATIVMVLVYLVLRKRGWFLKKKFKGGNLLNYMEPSARGVLEAASTRSSFVGGSFLLNLARELAETQDVEIILKKLGIDRSEFAGQADRYLASEKKLKETNLWREQRAKEVVIKALTCQRGEKHPISAKELFIALAYMENERLQRLFNIFGITPEGLEGKSRYNLNHAL